MPEPLPNYDTWKLATPPWYDDEQEGPEEDWTEEDYKADAADRKNDAR